MPPQRNAFAAGGEIAFFGRPQSSRWRTFAPARRANPD